ncbi:uncharacterized protein LOC129743098 [Uranotaenia lowii]|uniref:uncharacterized protein LOC129743098 n=1 Tax=Uranotaenia lowii TaxID=190385 RepID=UPI0024783750|nr:uncharacterized protein LOC129743098 [Uranotaenia lowii]
MLPYSSKFVALFLVSLQIFAVRGLDKSKSDQNEHTASKRASHFAGSLFPLHDKSALSGPSNLDFAVIGEDKILDTSSLLTSQYYSEDPNTDSKCSADKFAFNNEGTVSYENSLPALQQFTLCAWMRFTNHTGDHTIVTYAVDSDPREIQLWISNSRGMSYITLAIRGQSLFRLNYPFRMRRWHHACASWNGKTGEWQLWIKAERVGRGFHNRLVGYEIKPGGKLFSGGPSTTGPTDTDLHFELTMLQIYKVALSAGKAHRDHKHHHVHHFDHNGGEVTPAPPAATAPPVTQPSNPLLANGQIPSRVKINLAGSQNPPTTGSLGVPVKGLPSQLIGGFVPSDAATITTQFVSGQFHVGGRNLQQQLAIGNILNKLNTNVASASPSNGAIVFPDKVTSTVPSSSYIDLNNPANVQIIDESRVPQKLFKREASNVDSKTISKRGLVLLKDGTIADDGTGGSDYIFDGLAEFGLPDFKNKLGKETDIEGEIREHDREPAEGEVTAVMNVCTKCDDEPFSRAIVFAWKNIRAQMDNALTAKASTVCGQF